MKKLSDTVTLLLIHISQIVYHSLCSIISIQFPNITLSTDYYFFILISISGPHNFVLTPIKKAAEQAGQEVTLIEPYNLVEAHLASERKSKRIFEQSLKEKNT